MLRIHSAGFAAIAGLALALAACSGPGGNASNVAPVPTATPAPTATPTPVPTPGSIVLSSTAFAGNILTVTCSSTPVSFTLSQANYSGTFTVVSNQVGINVSPSSGTSATTFTLTNQSNYINLTTSMTITGGGGVTYSPTVYANSACG